MDKKLFDALQVRFVKLRFTAVCTEDCVLPRDKVSAIRGGMGEMLLRMNCVRDRECETCDFEAECIVQRIMYTQFVIKPFFATTDGGVGYVLECENYKEHFKSGESFDFYLLLFGKTIIYINQIYQALSTLGEREGIGKYHAKFQIQRITNMEGMSVLENKMINMDRYVIHMLCDYIMFRKMRMRSLKGSGKFMILFDSPLSLKYQNEYLQEFQIEPIINAVKRKIYMLNCLEGIESGILEYNEYPIPEILRQEKRLVGVKRFSMRKNEKMILRGLQGYVVVTGVTEELLELLLVGELIHIGKSTIFGFGRFHLKVVENEE